MAYFIVKLSINKVNFVFNNHQIKINYLLNYSIKLKLIIQSKKNDLNIHMKVLKTNDFLLDMSNHYFQYYQYIL